MSEKRPSRRDFLRGRAALDAAADAVESAIDAVADAVAPADGPAAAEARESARPSLAGAPSPEEQRRRRIVTLARRAMACEWELRLPASPDRNETDAGMAALDLVERLEQQLTVYRQTSELIELNRTAAESPVAVEPRLFGLLKRCDRLHVETEGAFDPTTGPLSRVWGFYQRAGEVPERSEHDAARERVGWRRVLLDDDAETVEFARAGVELNVNSIGKGYALDRCAELLAKWGVADSLMHGGRSTLVARGANPFDESGGWRTGVRHPLRTDLRVAEVVLRDEALSTSGSGTQFFEHGGRRYGHLIDPRTGWPAEGLYSATVIAPTGAEADALSTAAYLLGPAGVRRLGERRPDVRALLLAPAKAEDGDAAPPEEWGPPTVTIAGVAIYAINFRDDAWLAADARRLAGDAAEDG